ncbi:MAG: hypothetical protein G01um10147_1084 [Microgenomates group bacterium Gr01-1014_7]|nr:MAG: hypothetical protein G01um10147_1084 [Microgenomates group bacterium Gr01-1014_7]
MNPQEDNLVKIADVNLAAAILSTGKVKLLGIESDDPNRLFFLLSPKAICLELEQSYYNNTLITSAREMTNRIRELKDLLFGEKRKREGEKYGGNYGDYDR